jgi:hypothetical protein
MHADQAPGLARQNLDPVGYLLSDEKQEREGLICLTSPEPPGSRHVREKARLGKLRGFALRSNGENGTRK